VLRTSFVAERWKNKFLPFPKGMPMARVGQRIDFLSSERLKVKRFKRQAVVFFMFGGFLIFIFQRSSIAFSLNRYYF